MQAINHFDKTDGKHQCLK